MTYSVEQAEQTVPQNETKNPPDAKPADWRSPWKGAAIGGTLGGLITTALGYLYGHRGRWLAYDAIAGGGTGAAVGYGVDAHNNAKAVGSVKEQAISGPSREAEAVRQARREEQERISHQKAVEARKDTNARGGFAHFWDDLINGLKGGYIENFDEYKKTRETNRKIMATNALMPGGMGVIPPATKRK